MTAFTLLEGRLTLVCPKGYPRPPEDALHLAHFAAPYAQGTGVDAGCGIGTVGLALLALGAKCQLQGVDNQAVLIHAAAQNAEKNNAPYQATHGDILTHTPQKKVQFIVCNPPFYEEEKGHTTAHEANKARHHMPQGLLEAWLTQFDRWLEEGGWIALALHAHQQAKLEAWAVQNNYNLKVTPRPTTPNRPPKRILAKLDKPTPAS